MNELWLGLAALLLTTAGGWVKMWLDLRHNTRVTTRVYRATNGLVAKLVQEAYLRGLEEGKRCSTR